MIKPIFRPLIAFVMALALTIGCSSGTDTPVTTDTSDTMPVDAIAPTSSEPVWDTDILSELKDIPITDAGDSQEDRQILGYGNIRFDAETNTVTAEPDRTLNAHLNITHFIAPPQLVQTHYNPLTGILTVETTVTNSTLFTGYDLRIIIFTDDNGVRLMNPDNWTTLWDVPGGAQINPFKAYAKNQPNRKFSLLSSHTETLQLYYPQGGQQINYAIDVSWPSNCSEPYMITNFKQGDIYSTSGSSTQVSVDVYQLTRATSSHRTHKAAFFYTHDKALKSLFLLNFSYLLTSLQNQLSLKSFNLQRIPYDFFRGVT